MFTNTGITSQIQFNAFFLPVIPYSWPFPKLCQKKSYTAKTYSQTKKCMTLVTH